MYLSFSFLRCFLVIAALTLTFPLHALKGFSRSSEPFDKDYSIQILDNWVEVYSPGNPCPSDPLSQAMPEFWCVRHCIQLANGLFASNTMLYDDFSYRNLTSQYDCSGLVNVVKSDSKGNFEFSLIFEDGGLIKVDLWANDFEKGIDLPRIRSLEQLIETIPHWFYNELKFQYVLELTDGSFWRTPQRDSVWADPWLLQSRVLKMGTNREVLLLNLDSTSKQDPYISFKNCLRVEEKD
jgi:hypothetical protein